MLPIISLGLSSSLTLYNLFLIISFCRQKRSLINLHSLIMGGLSKFGCFFTVIIYAMFISQAFCARVRLSDGFFKPPVSHSVLETEPGLDLVLPLQNFQVGPSAAGPKSPDADPPSGLEDSDKNVAKALSRFPGKQGSEYRPLLLNLLPKGTLPPSGPSKRSNNLAN